MSNVYEPIDVALGQTALLSSLSQLWLFWRALPSDFSMRLLEVRTILPRPHDLKELGQLGGPKHPRKWTDIG